MSEIQDGRPAAILFFSDDLSSAKGGRHSCRLETRFVWTWCKPMPAVKYDFLRNPRWPPNPRWPTTGGGHFEFDFRSPNVRHVVKGTRHIWLGGRLASSPLTTCPTNATYAQCAQFEQQVYELALCKCHHWIRRPRFPIKVVFLVHFRHSFMPYILQDSRLPKIFEVLQTVHMW